MLWVWGREKWVEVNGIKRVSGERRREMVSKVYGQEGRKSESEEGLSVRHRERERRRERERW